MKTLIDKALKVCGSGKALAARLGVATTVISMMRNDRTITPEMAAMLASIAGDNPREAAVEAMVFNAIGTKRELFMKQIFEIQPDLLDGVTVDRSGCGLRPALYASH